MTNNDILKKLRVALMLRDDNIVDILQLVDFNISKSELGAFFRNEEHPKYMECGDQVLRNFLNGLVLHLRGTKENPKTPAEALASDFKPSPIKASASKKAPTPKSNRPDFKTQQRKKMNNDLSFTKYKNKKKS